MRVAVGIATTGRPETLNLVLRELMRQTRQADEIIICPARDEDYDQTEVERAGAQVVHPVVTMAASATSCLVFSSRASST